MLYPIFVNLHQKRCVVVGGGRVAERRIVGLLEQGAIVDVIAPEASPTIQHMFEDGAINWISEYYNPAHLAGAFLVIAATNNGKVNGDVSEEANRRNLLVCRADNADLGNYVTGSSINRGLLQISLTTAGASPTLAGVIKSELESAYGVEWEDWTTLFSHLRTTIQTLETEADRKLVVMNVLEDKTVRQLIQAGNVGEAEKAATLCILSHSA